MNPKRRHRFVRLVLALPILVGTAAAQTSAKQGIPVVGQRPEIVHEGGLMSYSSILQEQIRRATQLADKVLKGIKPADIPVEQPTKFEMLLNLKTAKALGIAIPQSVLIQATRVIE